jgi:hypothetical protein
MSYLYIITLWEQLGRIPDGFRLFSPNLIIRVKPSRPFKTPIEFEPLVNGLNSWARTRLVPPLSKGKWVAAFPLLATDPLPAASIEGEPRLR